MKMPASLQRFLRYFEAPTARLAVATTVALVVVCNQPFYPLYAYAIVGAKAWPAMLAWLSTPFYAAVPAVARRNALAASVLIVVTGIANTALCTKGLGPASLVELFYIPCILIAAGLFEGWRRFRGLALSAVGATLGMLGVRAFGAPLEDFTASENRSLATLHIVSVLCLSLLILYLQTRVARLRARQ
ncbi:hypothetical protein SAMN05444161_3916 [Rhizobiales bacterium GAS191]|nr:hypothetical protein SAMN05444161_3916 [Rhizobiales bacterium GAS191]